MRKNQKWIQEYIDYLFVIKDSKTKQERYERFKSQFPDTDFSFNSINNKASEVGAVRFNANKSIIKPLYSECIKKGYVFIKVTLPRVIWPKQKWVYLETHPWEYAVAEDTDVYIFLDGNNRNFNPDNIERLKRCEQTLFIQAGGVVKDNPELTRLNVLRARLKLAIFDVAEAAGETARTKSGRLLKSERNKKAREYMKKRYHNKSEYRQMKLASNKKSYEKMKQDPVRYAKHKEYHNTWAKNNRKKKKK